jgi:peptide/nickel transport system substrate-binding protein
MVSKMKRVALFGILAIFMGSFICLSPGLCAEAKYGGTLRIGASSDISGLDPYKTGWQNHEVLRQIFEGILAVDEGFKVIPGLAKTWEISDDGLTYTFHLRKGVLFHNGKEMTSSDVKASYERLLESPIKKKFETIKSIETPDKNTVVMHLSTPTATMLINIAQPHVIGIMPEEEAKSKANKTNITHPVGTGPFAFVEWVPDRHTKLTRFKEYWGGEGDATGTGGKKTAYVDDVIFMVMKERAIRTASLEAGNHDLGFIPTPQKARLEKNPDLKIVGTGPSLEFSCFWLSVKDSSPMRDMNMRLAFAHAINKQEMLMALNGGLGGIVNSPFSSTSAWYTQYHSTDYGPQQDLKKAKEYLKKAGYKGQTITISTCKDYPEMDKQAVVAQAQLKQAGFNVELEYLDWTSLFAKYKSGDFQVVSYGYGSHADPDMYYFARLSNGNTYNGWEDETFNGLTAKARVTSDFEARKAFYSDAQKILVDQLPLIPTFAPEYFYGQSKHVHGFKPWNAAFIRVWNIWLD